MSVRPKSALKSTGRSIRDVCRQEGYADPRADGERCTYTGRLAPPPQQPLTSAGRKPPLHGTCLMPLKDHAMAIADRPAVGEEYSEEDVLDFVDDDEPEEDSEGGKGSLSFDDSLVSSSLSVSSASHRGSIEPSPRCPLNPDPALRIRKADGVRISKAAETVRESDSLLALYGPALDPRIGRADEVRDSCDDHEVRGCAEGSRLEETEETFSFDAPPSLPVNMPRARAGASDTRLSREELSFLADFLAERSAAGSEAEDGLGDEDGGDELEGILRMSMAVGGDGAAVWREAPDADRVGALPAQPPSSEESGRLLNAHSMAKRLPQAHQQDLDLDGRYQDPPLGSLGRLLQREIEQELQQDRLVDFTRLSVCSRSEVGSVNALVSTRQDIHHSEEANHEAKLRQSLERLHRDITRARDGEMQEKAVLLMEDALGLLAELEGDDGDALLSLCEQLVKDYNSLGLRLLDNGAYESAYEMLKKAELLTEPSSSLRARPLARLKLRAITFNNLGCYYKQRGKLHAALHYLERAVKIEEAAAVGSVENPASTHLNIAATLSKLGRHSTAVDYAARAVELLRHELGLDEGDLVAGVGDLVAGRPDSRTVKASLSILSVALYNQAVEMEHLGQSAPSLRAYAQAAAVSRQSAGAKDPTTVMLAQAERAFRRKVGALQSRKLSSPQTAAREQHGAVAAASQRAAPRPESAPMRRAEEAHKKSGALPRGLSVDGSKRPNPTTAISRSNSATSAGRQANLPQAPPGPTKGRRPPVPARSPHAIQRSNSLPSGQGRHPRTDSGSPKPAARPSSALQSTSPGARDTGPLQQSKPQEAASRNTDQGNGARTAVTVALRLRRVDGSGFDVPGTLYRNGKLVLQHKPGQCTEGRAA